MVCFVKIVSLWYEPNKLKHSCLPPAYFGAYQQRLHVNGPDRILCTATVWPASTGPQSILGSIEVDETWPLLNYHTHQSTCRRAGAQQESSQQPWTCLVQPQRYRNLSQAWTAVKHAWEDANTNANMSLIHRLHSCLRRFRCSTWTKLPHTASLKAIQRRKSKRIPQTDQMISTAAVRCLHPIVYQHQNQKQMRKMAVLSCTPGTHL